MGDNRNAMNLRDREPRKNDNDDNDDVVLKSKEPDESQATIENDREKESELDDEPGNEHIKESIMAILQGRETARFDDFMISNRLIECAQSDLVVALEELVKDKIVKCVEGLYMLNDSEVAESDDDDLINGKMVVTISRKQFFELEQNERVLISIEGNEEDPETVLERLRYEQLGCLSVFEQFQICFHKWPPFDTANAQNGLSSLLSAEGLQNGQAFE